MRDNHGAKTEAIAEIFYRAPKQFSTIFIKYSYVLIKNGRQVQQI